MNCTKGYSRVYPCCADCTTHAHNNQRKYWVRKVCRWNIISVSVIIVSLGSSHSHRFSQQYDCAPNRFRVLRSQFRSFFFSSIFLRPQTASCMSRDCMHLIRCNKTFVIYASVELHNCITWNFYLWPFAAASEQYYSLVESTSTQDLLLHGNMDLECVEWSTLVRVRISYCSFISRCTRVEKFHSHGHYQVKRTHMIDEEMDNHNLFGHTVCVCMCMCSKQLLEPKSYEFFRMKIATNFWRTKIKIKFTTIFSGFIKFISSSCHIRRWLLRRNHFLPFLFARELNRRSADMRAVGGWEWGWRMGRMMCVWWANQHLHRMLRRWKQFKKLMVFYVKRIFPMCVIAYISSSQSLTIFTSASVHTHIHEMTIYRRQKLLLINAHDFPGDCLLYAAAPADEATGHSRCCSIARVFAFSLWLSGARWVCRRHRNTHIFICCGVHARAYRNRLYESETFFALCFLRSN